MSISNNLFKGKFGLERETLRIDRNGRLAKTPHPFGDEKHITRDFCENQIEIVTPVCNSIDEVMDSLKQLDSRVKNVLQQNDETLWLYSNPPYIENESEILIAKFKGKESSKSSYRRVLEQKYGKKLMLFSGIHFNFSFDEQLLRDMNSNNINHREFKDTTYLRLYKQLILNSWLLVLLTASSSYYDASLDKTGESGILKSEYSSMRNSQRGYWNKFVPVLDHSNLKAFTQSIQSYVDRGELYSASELYLPVRLKPKGENSLTKLSDNGVDHIELRMFDINPYVPLGIDDRDLKFAHLLMLYLLSLPDIDLSPKMQITALAEHKNAALLKADEKLLKRGRQVMSDTEQYCSFHSPALEIISFEKKKLNRNIRCNKTICKFINKAVI